MLVITASRKVHIFMQYFNTILHYNAILTFIVNCICELCTAQKRVLTVLP